MNTDVLHSCFEKIALNSLKLHELAKEVGVIAHPESQWKWKNT